MDKHQELRTNLVLEANSALSAIKELSDGLDKISRLKFDNVKDGFKSLTDLACVVHFFIIPLFYFSIYPTDAKIYPRY